MKSYSTDIKKIDYLIQNHCYQEALNLLTNIEDDDSNILYRKGSLYAILGDFSKAIFYLHKTIKAETSNEFAWLNLAKAYSDINDVNSALQCYEKLLNKFPLFVEGWINYSSFLNDNDLYDTTIYKLSNLIKTIKDRFELFANLGYAYKKRKNYQQAINCFDNSIALNQNFIPGHINKIESLIKLQLFDRAEHENEKFNGIFDDSDFIELKLEILVGKKKYADAINYLRAVKNQVGEEIFLAKLAHLFMLSKQIHKSLFIGKLACKKYPNSSEACSNVGIIFHYFGKYQDAKQHFLKSLEINSQESVVWSNLGVTQMMLMEFADARISFKNSAQIDPFNGEAIWNESLLDLVEGNLVEGFKKFESRFQLPDHQICPFWGLPNIKDISSINNKKILVWSEQGLGDSIHFIRYLELLLWQNVEVFFLVQKELTKLFRFNFDVTITDNLDDLSEIVFDAEVSLMSLPHYFETSFDTIPNNVPYIKAPKDSIEIWRERVAQSGRQKKIGIAVSGRQDYDEKHGNLRPIPLKFFDRFADMYEIHLIQKDLLVPDKEFLEKNPPHFFVYNDLSDFSDTAALVELMDIIVSVDTSLVHLAGAMAKPTFLLSSSPPTWRWFIDIPYSPWYPTISIIRQKKSGKWDDVIEELDQRIREII